MLLKQLKYFISIIEKGNFTEAAEENYISQSAISQQIQSLENELGYKLLIREKRTFTLTPAGKYIYNQSKNILENIENMQEKAKFIASNNNYSIKIGYLKNYTGNELQRAIVELYIDTLFGALWWIWTHNFLVRRREIGNNEKLLK